MMAKVLKSRRRRSFKELIDYVSDDAKGAALEIRNLADLSTAEAEMEATAILSRRCKEPAYHFEISWSAEEKIDEAGMRQALDRALNALGLSEHQAVTWMHANTDHPHLHVVVNRVHPTTYRARSTWQDWTRLDRVVEEMAIAYQWKVTTSRRVFDPTLGRGMQYGPAWAKPTFSGWLNAHLRLKVANLLASGHGSWEQFHELVGSLGARYETAPRGAVFIDAGRPETAAGASRVMRLCSLPTLERVLGPYRPAMREPLVANGFSRQDFVEPRDDLREQYAKTVTEQRAEKQALYRSQLAAIRDEERASRMAAQEVYREHQAITKAFSPELRAPLLAAARQERMDAYDAAHRLAIEKRQRLDRPPAVPTFSIWLYEQVRCGNNAAITFIAEQRQRRRVMRLPLPEIGQPQLHERVLQTIEPVVLPARALDLEGFDTGKQIERQQISGSHEPHVISEG